MNNYRLPRASKRTANELLNYNDTLYPAADISEDSSISSQDSSDADSNDSDDGLDLTSESGHVFSSPSTSGRHYRWRKRGNAKFPCNFVTQQMYHNNDVEEEIINSGPYAQFKSYVTDDLLAYISEQTNMYSVAKSGVSINTTRMKLRNYLQFGCTPVFFPHQVIGITGLQKLVYLVYQT